MVNQNISFEQYKSHLDEKQAHIQKLLVDQALSQRDKAELEQQLAEVQKRISGDRDGYLAHTEDLKARIKALIN
ncbi:MAG: hypothetical protein GY814_17585 [Gammaproteobacteria bacterium]|nr:hypothetical protein [Gammaproteobacteria bacterium]